jgi:hypothetical protein
MLSLAVKETIPPALIFEKLMIEPLFEVRSRLLVATISEKLLLVMLSLAVMATLFTAIDPELLRDHEFN